MLGIFFDFAGHIAAIATWAISAAAISSNTWNANARGLNKLTPSGRVIAILALAGLTFSLLHLQSEQTKEQRESQLLSNINGTILIMRKDLGRQLSQISESLTYAGAESMRVDISRQSQKVSVPQGAFVTLFGFNCSITVYSDVGSPLKLKIKEGQSGTIAFNKKGSIKIPQSKSCAGQYAIT